MDDEDEVKDVGNEDSNGKLSGKNIKKSKVSLTIKVFIFL